MQNDPQDKQLRSFGLILGGIFGVIAVWPLIFHGAQARSWATVAAAVLIIPALIDPRALYWIHKGWMALGHVMGWINTRIILGLVFYLIVTPIGFIRHAMGKDSMGKEFAPDAGSYRVARKVRPATHLTRQF
jgi:multisubunit Na+/H+ antiporter MnhG subunit